MSKAPLRYRILLAVGLLMLGCGLLLRALSDHTAQMDGLAGFLTGCGFALEVGAFVSIWLTKRPRA